MADTWEALRAECAACRGCALADTRTHVVFGDGCETAEIMLIGEGPGQHEDEHGIPFVGRAGQLLDDMLEIIHLDRTKVYIANVVKCRPPNNRQPTPEEMAACLPHLRGQAALVRPRVILLLGATAVAAVLGPDERITRCRGRWFERKGTHIIATYHPSALLRDPSKKRAAWEDLQSLRQRLTELSLYPDLLKEDRP